MYKTCTCGQTNPKRRCFHNKICQLVLPSMDEVATKLKAKYDESSYSKIIPTSAQQHVLVVERANYRKVNPDKMIYFKRSPDYCVADPDYNITGIEGRECVLSNPQFSHHCDNLCCDHGYKTFTYRIESICCKYIWCCRTECKVCHETKIKHRCKNQPDVSSTN